MPVSLEKDEDFGTTVLPAMLALKTLEGLDDRYAEANTATSTFRTRRDASPALEQLRHDSSYYLDANVVAGGMPVGGANAREQPRDKFLPIWDDAFVGQAVVRGSGRDWSIVPGAFRSAWFRLGQSKMSSSTFTHLLAASFAQEFSKPTRTSRLSSGSLLTFLKFWDALGGACAEPSLSISPKGDVVAEWFRDPDNSLVIMAHRDRVLHFSLFADAAPVEGWEHFEAIPEVVAMLRARRIDPFYWSDANEG